MGFISEIVFFARSEIFVKLELAKNATATRVSSAMFKRRKSQKKEKILCLGKMVNVNRCQVEGKADQLLPSFFIKEDKAPSQ